MEFSKVKEACYRLDQAQREFDSASDRYLAEHELQDGDKVLFNDEEYYVFKRQIYDVSFGDGELWLSLTKLTSKGQFPKRILQSTYCRSDKVTKVVTDVENSEVAGDNSNLSDSAESGDVLSS